MSSKGRNFTARYPFTVEAQPGVYILKNKSIPNQVLSFSNTQLPQSFSGSGIGFWDNHLINWCLCDFVTSFGFSNNKLPSPEEINSALLSIIQLAPFQMSGSGAVSSVDNDTVGTGVPLVNNSTGDVIVKKIKAGSNCTVDNDGHDVTINAVVPSQNPYWLGELNADITNSANGSIGTVQFTVKKNTFPSGAYNSPTWDGTNYYLPFNQIDEETVTTAGYKCTVALKWNTNQVNNFNSKQMSANYYSEGTFNSAVMYLPAQRNSSQTFSTFTFPCIGTAEGTGVFGIFMNPNTNVDDILTLKKGSQLLIEKIY